MDADRRYSLQADSWLSGVLQRPAWNVVAHGVASTPLAELRRPGAQFATAKVAAVETAEAEALQSFGFRVVDTALSFEAESLSAPERTEGVRFARPGDRAAVEAIAGSAFRFSRFHLDPHLPRALADKVKAGWAGNWFSGARGDGMIVAEDAQGTVAGFLQLIWGSGERLVIDLVAVRADRARRGLARAMIGHAQAHGTDGSRRPRGMIVGTQAANVASLRLYESMGFRLRDAKFVLHHHGSAA